MQIIVIKKNKLNTFTLPEVIEGSHWITDFENGKKINLISVEAKEGKWQIESNQSAFIVDDKDVMIPYVFLKEYSFYLLKNNYKNEKHYIYCAPLNDKTYKEFGISKPVIFVGSNKDCDICCKMSGIPEKAFSINKESDGYYLNILDMNAGVYLNQKRVLQKEKFEYGDLIFTFGLKLVLMRKERTDYLLVNNPAGTIDYSVGYTNVNSVPDTFVDDGTMIGDESFFSEDDYYYRTPYFYSSLEEVEIKIDAPPHKKDEKGLSTILTIGPMLTMSMTSVMSLYSTFNAISSGERTMKQSLPSVVMGCTMLLSCLLWPSLTRIFQKRADIKWEKKRQEQYKNYIDKKAKEIENKKLEQQNLLIDNNLTISQCQEVILSKGIKLWQRRITDDKFLSIPVGIGNVSMPIKIQYPEEHFSLEEDNLLDMVHQLGQKERILQNVPVTFSFYENVATGIVGNGLFPKEFVDRLILQIISQYSYDEVKLVILTSPDNEKNWDYTKILPYIWTNDMNFRYFGSSNDEYREIIYNLDSIFNIRKDNDKLSKTPHYIIITDAIKSIDNFDFIKNVMEQEKKCGFSMMILVDKITALPNECKNFIYVSNDGCNIFSSELSQQNQKFMMDLSPIDKLYDCAKMLANIPMDIKTDIESNFPSSYNFLEMYQVGKVEQLNCPERWKKNNPILSLQAPIGIGKTGELITLDLHEKYHGPHGLIAGTTGSGKSEFIITYILSLAVNFHPNEVQIILIDYKGGSLAGAFTNDRYKLPHLAGTITNLDGNELNRSLASIESEVKRRQKAFNEAKNIAGESNLDIYKYQKLYREGKLTEPIAHLFIVSDEFAELKEQQPEFMDKLISVARVGRSLGVHLILATQKPGGVVNAQIWSNSRFKVCLKVQDAGDSQEVLRKPDAAYLKQTGRFYLQVGYDEIYTIGQAAWAGADYFPSSALKKVVDISVKEVNNIGYVTTNKEEKKDNEFSKSVSDQLSSIASYICEVAKSEDIKVKKLWLDRIPDIIYVDKLKEKYSFQKRDYYIEPIVGEYDDPTNQTQSSLYLPFSKNGHVILYGNADSGKEKFLSTVIYSCMSSYRPEEVNFYILDFGTETMKMFFNSPYVGDVILLNDEEKLVNFFKMLESEVSLRKEKFSTYGGNYNSFIEKSDEKLSNIILIINEMENFTDNYEELSENFAQLLREISRYGIYALITASSQTGVKLKVRQNISESFVLQLNDDEDYRNILGNCKGKIPGRVLGRGLFKGDNIYEFQTASIAEEEIDFIKEYCANVSKNTAYRAKRVPALPKVVDYNFVENELSDDSSLVIGVNKQKLNIEKYNFQKNVINIISAQEIENTYITSETIIKQAILNKYFDILVINCSEFIFDDKVDKFVAKQKFDDVINQLKTFSNSVYKVYEDANFDDNILKKQKHIMVFIYGLSSFLNKISDESKDSLLEIVKESKKTGVVIFTIIDNADEVKAHAYDEWVKTGFDSARGIWIGSGITEQTLFRYSKSDREDRLEITNDFGYIINNTRLNKLKLLTSFEEEEML